jgi:RNA polymerase primary sigma factor
MRSLETLTPQEEHVLRLCYGLSDDSDEHSHEDIAALLGVSRSRVHQIHQKALRKLRHPARTRTLRPFLSSCDV